MNIVPKDIYQLAILESLSRDRSRAFYTLGEKEYKKRAKELVDTRNKELAEENRKNKLFYNTLYGLEKNIVFEKKNIVVSFGSFDDLAKAFHENGISTFPNEILLPVDAGRKSLNPRDAKVFENESTNSTNIKFELSDNTKITQNIIVYTFFNDEKFNKAGAKWLGARKAVREKIPPIELNTSFGKIMGYMLSWPDKGINVYFIDKINVFLQKEMPIDLITLPETLKKEKLNELLYKSNELFNRFPVFGVKKGLSIIEKKTVAKYKQVEEKAMDKENTKTKERIISMKSKLTKIDLDIQLKDGFLHDESNKPMEAQNNETIEKLKNEISELIVARDKEIENMAKFKKEQIYALLADAKKYENNFLTICNKAYEYASDALSNVGNVEGSKDIALRYTRIMESCEAVSSRVKKFSKTLDSYNEGKNLLDIKDMHTLYTELKNIVEKINTQIFIQSEEVKSILFNNLIAHTSLNDVADKSFKKITSKLVMLGDLI